MPGEMSVQWLGEVDYARSLSLQEELAELRCRGERPDTLLLLEHPPCYSVGRMAENVGHELDGLPLFHTDRGGGITFHGPGQLVGYPIFALKTRDLSRFVAWIEDSLIACLEEVGVRGETRPPLRGVWVGKRKIASIGLKLRRGVTMHGFALNLSMDLRPFERILPCGLPIRMTSVLREGGVGLSTERFAELLSRVAIPRWLQGAKEA